MSTKAKESKKRKADAFLQAEEAADQPKQKKQKLNLEIIPEKPPDNVEMEEHFSNISDVNEVVGESFELPPEILVSIFSGLDWQDLSHASCVCQHWWLCSKDESLAWSYVTTKQFFEDSICYSTAFDKCTAISK